jgi:hypothetical protein
MLRLCIDLNIWVAALLADCQGISNTASQYLVEIVRSGVCPVGETSLIISTGMLSDLTSILLEYLNITIDDTLSYVSAVKDYAKLETQSTLSGTGVIVWQYTTSLHILEAAIAGNAHFLVTANVKHFIECATQVEIPDRHVIYRSPAHSVHIVHPYLMVEWLRVGSLPTISLQ